MRRVPAELALARVTLGDYLGLRAGEPLTIETWSQGLPWARALLVEARRRGCEPVLAVEDEEGFFRSLAAGPGVPRAPAALARLGGTYAYLPGPEAFPRLFGLRPTDLRPALDRHGGPWLAAARASGLRAARLSVAGVTATAAARFGVNLDAWRSEVVDASLVASRRLRGEAVRLARGLARARTAVITHPNGTRCEVRVRGDRWSEETGRPGVPAHRRDTVWTALPTGRLILPVAPGTATGVWEANRSSYDRYADEPVETGGRFELRAGRLTAATFDRGGEGFAATFSKARRTPRAISGLSIGLNPRIARAPEAGDLARGAVGLRIEVATGPGGVAGPRPAHVALLTGADVEVDGRPWIVGGRLAPGHVARRVAARRSGRSSRR